MGLVAGGRLLPRLLRGHPRVQPLADRRSTVQGDAHAKAPGDFGGLGDVLSLVHDGLQEIAHPALRIFVVASQVEDRANAVEVGLGVLNVAVPHRVQRPRARQVRRLRPPAPSPAHGRQRLVRHRLLVPGLHARLRVRGPRPAPPQQRERLDVAQRTGLRRLLPRRIVWPHAADRRPAQRWPRRRRLLPRGRPGRHLARRPPRRLRHHLPRRRGLRLGQDDPDALVCRKDSAPDPDPPPGTQSAGLDPFRRQYPRTTAPSLAFGWEGAPFCVQPQTGRPFSHRAVTWAAKRSYSPSSPRRRRCSIGDSWPSRFEMCGVTSI